MVVSRKCLKRPSIFQKRPSKETYCMSQIHQVSASCVAYSRSFKRDLLCVKRDRQKRPTTKSLPVALRIWNHSTKRDVGELLFFSTARSTTAVSSHSAQCQKRPSMCQKSPSMCQKRPSMYQKRPSMCQKRPSSVKRDLVCVNRDLMYVKRECAKGLLHQLWFSLLWWGVLRSVSLWTY